MGKDNQPKVRQAAKLARKKARRAGYERILIVSEGSKTEPLYFNEIRAHYRLHTANVQVRPGLTGTQPLQVVEYAEQLFTSGDATRNIQPRAFERVYAVFDRDDHSTYVDALEKAARLDGKMRNDLKQPVVFQAMASVPCFELWLLLHFQDVRTPLHRTEVYQRLRQYLSGYDKGQSGHFEATRELLDVATPRAEYLGTIHSARHGEQPYTDIHRLVRLLTTLKSE